MNANKPSLSCISHSAVNQSDLTKGQLSYCFCLLNELVSVETARRVHLLQGGGVKKFFVVGQKIMSRKLYAYSMMEGDTKSDFSQIA